MYEIKNVQAVACWKIPFGSVFVIWIVWGADKRIGMFEEMTQLDIYLCIFCLFGFFVFLGNLKLFYKLYNKKREREKQASVHVPSRNNLIFQSIPQSVDGQ